jgi:uncharacterized DUF497 family protein
MKISFDANKNAINITKHSVSLIMAEHIEWETALIWPDTRRDYGEPCIAGLGYIGTRLYFVVFVDRPKTRRIISLRKANNREVSHYASA